MDETIKQLLKAFGHIAREIQIYLFSGIVLLLNYLFLYRKHECSNLRGRGELNALNFVILAIIAYVLGQVCLGIYLGVSKLWNRPKDGSREHEEIVVSEVRGFAKDEKTYKYFVERYSLLHMMRGAISAAFFLIFLSDLIYLWRIEHAWKASLGMFSLLSLAISIALCLLAKGTRYEMQNRIKAL